MKLAEVLTGPETWCQGAYETHHGRHCVVGAFVVLVMLEGWKEQVTIKEFNRFISLVQRDYGQEQLSITGWNDDPIRTWNEVAAVVEAYDRDRMLNP